MVYTQQHYRKVCLLDNISNTLILMALSIARMLSTTHLRIEQQVAGLKFQPSSYGPLKLTPSNDYKTNNKLKASLVGSKLNSAFAQLIRKNKFITMIPDNFPSKKIDALRNKNSPLEYVLTPKISLELHC